MSLVLIALIGGVALGLLFGFALGLRVSIPPMPNCPFCGWEVDACTCPGIVLYDYEETK